ncbi:three-deoxy-D-manno-octulosonic-acid transferase domain protein [Candidatus Vecturithrix granuli]|uniref:3-deoxy-D-manno-octulosonic acid transferase n=1 Tax=Vecturithrix granuli TaxID=1499967 RepID=A0A081C0D7_VECG1|nr:three-deoxy-D-manno-octulosonic-acid transferase domain protein [Candidatus Vecturithrix granuli]
MNQRIWRLCYSWFACPLGWLVGQLLAFKNQTLKESLDGRKGLWQRLDAQLVQRDQQKPLVWFHVASAGEFLQAQPVFERCMQHGFECAITVMSVNGYKWIQKSRFRSQRPVVIEYLPLDFARNMRRLLQKLQPAVIVYVNYDLWPNLIWEAYAAGIPQYLISATIQPRSKRLTSAIARSLYRTLYACLNGIFTVTENDQQRFLATNPEHPNIQVLGDTRFDSVIARKRTLAPPKLPAYIQNKFVIVVGSSSTSDDVQIFPPLKEALQRYTNVFLIIVPHEPTEEYLQNGETFFHDFPGERLTTLQEHPTQAPRIIFVDTVGVLSALYSVGTLAYVGGGFGPRVHNVMEPAVMGLPVIFGPLYDNSPEAIDLLRRGFAFTVKNTEEFRAQLFEFLDNPEKCKQLGQQAQQVIESQAGAAERCFELITASRRDEKGVFA